MKTFGKVAGGLGLLLVLTAWAPLWAASSPTAFYVAMGLGLALLGIYLATNRGELRGTLARSAFFHGSSASIGLATLLALVAINFIAAKRGKTWDLTAKQIYSLSPQTTQALKDLKEPVVAYVFLEAPGTPFSVEALFRRYKSESDQFSWDFKEINKAPDLVKKYDIRPGQLAVLVKKGASGELHATMNLQRLAGSASQEQELTQALLKLNGVGQQKVYFLTGHGEPQLNPSAKGMTQEQVLSETMVILKRVLDEEGYVPTELNLIETLNVPSDASAVVVSGPKGELTEGEEASLEKYLEQGGRMIYFSPYSEAKPLRKLLAKYGVEVEGGLVVDPSSNPRSPYAVPTTDFADHPIVEPLSKAGAVVMFPRTRGLSQLREGLLAGVTVSPLVLSMQNAWIESDPTETPTLDSGERSGKIPLALVATRNTAQAADKRYDEARLVVFGSSQLTTGGFAAVDANPNLVLNTFAWVCEQSKKLTIRPPDRDLSTLDINDAMLGNLRLITMYMVPVLLLGIGLTIWQTRRAR